MMDDNSVQKYREVEAKLWAYYGIQPKEDYYLDLERPRLRVRIQELGEGPALLFLHGSPSCGTIWAALAAKLTDYRCLLLDMPGHGLSEPGDYRSPDIQTLVTGVIDSVLEALELDQLPLIASSSGGAMAYWYALARPQQVERMVQLGCPFLLEGAPITMFTRLLTIPRLNRSLFNLMPADLKTMRNIYTMIGHGPAIEDGRIPDCFLEWALRLTADTYTTTGMLDLMEAGMNWRGIRPEAMIGQAELARITQPTQYIWSEDDPDGGASLAQETARRTPNSELHLLPGSGHLPWLDAPDKVAGLIRDFLHPIQMSPVAAANERRIS